MHGVPVISARSSIQHASASRQGLLRQRKRLLSDVDQVWRENMDVANIDRHDRCSFKGARSTAPLQILLASWGNAGSLSPLLTGARRLQERGHDVRVLADASDRDEINQAGFEHRCWHRPTPMQPVVLPGEDPAAAEVRMMFKQLIFGSAMAYAQDTMEELHRMPADLVVTSDILMGPAIAAEALRLPYALLAPHVSIRPLDGVPPAASGLAPRSDPALHFQERQARSRLELLMADGLPVLNKARHAFRLAPLGHAFEHYDRADRVLIGLAAAFDFPAIRLPPNVRYVGPLLDLPKWARPWTAPWSAAVTRPRVLVSLSTSFQNQADVLGRIIEALGTMEVDAIVTAGPALDGVVLPASRNVSIVHSAPHDTVMQQVDAVITHGGHGTVTRSLLYGVPLLVVPMGRDQGDNAVRVVTRGAGLTLDQNATRRAIVASLGRVIGEESFKSAAKSLGARIANEVDSPVLVAELEAIASPRLRQSA